MKSRSMMRGKLCTVLGMREVQGNTEPGVLEEGKKPLFLDYLISPQVTVSSLTWWAVSHTLLYSPSLVLCPETNRCVSKYLNE